MTHADVQPAEDAAGMGMNLAKACAPAFVVCARLLSPQDQVDFVHGFLACISGMAQQAIGHTSTVDLLNAVAALPAAGGSHPVQ